MGTLRVVVDRDLCESNGVCVQIAPDVFRIDDATDRMELLCDVTSDGTRESIENAVRMCPRGALSLTSQPYGGAAR